MDCDQSTIDRYQKLSVWMPHVLSFFVNSLLFSLSTAFILDCYWWRTMLLLCQRQEQKKWLSPSRKATPRTKAGIHPQRRRRLPGISSEEFNHHCWRLLPKQQFKKGNRNYITQIYCSMIMPVLVNIIKTVGRLFHIHFVHSLLITPWFKFGLVNSSVRIYAISLGVE